MSPSGSARFSQEPFRAALFFAGFAFLWAGALWMRPVGDFRNVDQLRQFLVGAAIMLGGFFAVLSSRKNPGAWFWIGAIGWRVLLIGMYPGDDIWRYIWEGKIQSIGLNPYLSAPNDPHALALRDAAWPLVQHHTVTALYPPLAEWMFHLIAAISQSPFVWKSFFCAADLAVCGLLVRRFGIEKSLWYAWNPLTIYCFSGGGHYDSVFILVLISAWFSFERTDEKRWWMTALWLGLSIALKWMSLPLLAWVAYRALRETRNLWRASGIMIVGLIPFILVWEICYPTNRISDFFPHQFVEVARGCDLVPWLIAQVWPDSVHFNQVHLIPLGIAGLLLLFWVKDFAQAAERWFFALFIFSPVMNAWYFCWILPFAVKSGNWGARLSSASAFVYFWLHYHKVIDHHWNQSPLEKILLWGPYVAGFIYSQWVFAKDRSPTI